MRQRNFRSSLLGLTALLVLVCSLALVACDDDGDDGDFDEATPADLENQTFTFNGGFFDIPEGTPFTLTFGDFGGDTTAPFTVATATNTASGTVTVESCTFDFGTDAGGTSDFPEDAGPQVDDEVESDCELDDQNRLILDEDVSGSTGTTGG